MIQPTNYEAIIRTPEYRDTVFDYLIDDSEIVNLAVSIMMITDKYKDESSKFWKKSETALLCAIISYIHYHMPQEKHNFKTVGEMLTKGHSYFGGSSESELDVLFEDLKANSPDCFSVKMFSVFKTTTSSPLRVVDSCTYRLCASHLIE